MSTSTSMPLKSYACSAAGATVALKAVIALLKRSAQCGVFAKYSKTRHADDLLADRLPGLHGGEHLRVDPVVEGVAHPQDHVAGAAGRTAPQQFADRRHRERARRWFVEDADGREGAQQPVEGVLVRAGGAREVRRGARAVRQVIGNIETSGGSERGRDDVAHAELKDVLHRRRHVGSSGLWFGTPVSSIEDTPPLAAPLEAS